MNLSDHNNFSSTSNTQQNLNLNAYLQQTNTKDDDHQLMIASLMNDLSNIRQTQQSYGIPAIGDLFRAKPDDIQDTITSVYHMMRQRAADIEFRQEARGRWAKLEADKQESQDACTRVKAINEKLSNENKDLRNQLASMEMKHKSEVQRFTSEKDDLTKKLTQMVSKETQYRHEIKSRDLQIEKLKESYKLKLFEKATTKEQIQGSFIRIGGEGNVLPGELKYSSLDFQKTMSDSQSEIIRRVCDENDQLKACLKNLQQEMFEIVDLKTALYRNRFEAELNLTSGDQQQQTFDVVRHDLERIREELFGMPYDEVARDLIMKFQRNFSKLRDFLERVDKDIAQLSVFKASAGIQGESAAGVDEDFEYDDEDENDGQLANNGKRPMSPKNGQKNLNKQNTQRRQRKFKGISSVTQLKHLLRNYDALVEGQHSLLTQSIAKMAKIPPADEISSTFNRFQILKDSELDEMRAFVNDHKLVMQNQYRDFENERRQFEDMNTRMEAEKLKIAEDRERIEAEVRKIRELNREMTASLQISAK